ncbi:MAG TPA: N-acetyl-1-D-myo-inositol-2-amino-2-deoxy-alpha-D-glucopyranoside deacetylase [Streptosporangiaceae bacterium]|jgi:N-acetyl-1-D-myo-inositol-2-amino-2-deoxy-alpha-D-glucopyranoside deacetylase
MSLSPGDRSLLLVHAHPDDESIGTGATMAKYAAEGARVTLVTCTLGELGEIIPPRLAHLAADRDGGLGEYRIGELARACEALGVRDHRFLGGAGRWRDSGMMGTEGNDAPDCFWRADLDEAAAALLDVIREVRPQVMVSYNAFGGYGHPDHIQAHRVTQRAFELAAGPPHQVAKLYATAVPIAARLASIDLDPAAARTGPAAAFRQVKVEDLSPATPDDEITTEIDATAYLPAKLAAMSAHETQITVDGEFFALSNHIGRRATAREYYTLQSGSAPHPREQDLFT